MNIKNVKEITEELGLTWKGDFMDALSEEEKDAGYMKFNIPSPNTPEALNGEGVWGWMSPENKKKYEDDNFIGELPAILCNDSFTYFGRLFAGQEVVVRCTGSTRPILDPEWVREHLLSDGEPADTKDNTEE